jgi:peptide/nickel transport system ATP-binding protein
MAATSILSVSHLQKSFASRSELARLFSAGQGEIVRAVDDVGFDIQPGEIVGLIGESGSGKTTIGRLLVRLEHHDAGSVVFDGDVDVGALKGKDLRDYYRSVQMIFQDPYESINPRFTVFDTVCEPLKTQKLGTRADRMDRVLQALERAGLRPPRSFVDKYPHEMSGGERQRLSIARALVLEPKLLIADEPVSMLDVSIRAGILNLLKRLSREFGLTILYISHDLSTTRYLCDRIIIMYRGTFVEMGDAEQVIDDPKHPYAQALKAAVPVPDPEIVRPRSDADLDTDMAQPDPNACRYVDLCPHAMAVCRASAPALRNVGACREVACHLYEDVSPRGRRP